MCWCHPFVFVGVYIEDLSYLGDFSSVEGANSRHFGADFVVGRYYVAVGVHLIMLVAGSLVFSC